jgi:hypothetical protein
MNRFRLNAHPLAVALDFFHRRSGKRLGPESGTSFAGPYGPSGAIKRSIPAESWWFHADT